VANRTVIDVKLVPVTEIIDEVVVVGYGVQKKATLTGAVSAIKSSEIITTKNENLQNMLTGKVAGVRVVQNTSEPGGFNVSFDVRDLGTPLVVIDGIPRTNMTRIDANDVESISVLKDASAAIYGVRAGGGVVLITTKKGAREKSEINYSGNYGWQIPSGFPDMVNAIDYMTLTNEKSMHNINNPVLTYPDEQFTPYLDGTLHSTNWKNAVMRNAAPQTQHNISATGGNDRINYYMSLGYTYQGSFLQTDDLNYDRYNLRGNISAKVTKHLTVDMNISGIMDEKEQPNPANDAWWIVRNIWIQRPMETIYANNNPGYFLETAVTGDNPVAMMDADITGYRKTGNKWLQSSVSATYNVPNVKGLQLKGIYSYDYNNTDNRIFRKSYTQYRYVPGTDSYSTFTKQSPASIRREFYSKSNSLWNVSVNYNNKFGGSHDISGLLLFEHSTSNGDNFYAQRDLSIPIEQLFAGNSTNQIGNMSSGDNALYELANQALVGRVNYGYQSKYLVELSFRYDGSSKFPPDTRWVLFPSGSVGWILSEENFWKNSKLDFIDYFKLRASYGKMGDDAALRFQFYQGFTYPASGNANGLPGGHVFNGQFVNSSVTSGIPNSNISWTISKMLNIGMDFNAWNGLFGGTVELFRRNRDGLLTTRTQSLPDIVGATLPQENLNSDQTSGLEIELSHRNHINDFSYALKGNVSLTRTKAIHQERAKAGNSYDNWRNNRNGRWNDVWWGYDTDKQYGSWADINNSSVYVVRNAIIGDYAYEDWNGDGLISDLDVHPVANSNKSPWVNFGFNISANYKGFDVNILLQGAALRTISYTELVREPLWAGTGALIQFTDRWHPADPKADPYDPNIKWIEGYYAYTGSLPDVNSKFNMQNASYLRLKNAELGYTLPRSLTTKLGIKELRMYVNGYNLLTATKLKYMDPEHTSDNYGYMYPINKSINIGLNIKF
jgi:TonB-linked SusC/RagA family outer membrane protein